MDDILDEMNDFNYYFRPEKEPTTELDPIKTGQDLVPHQTLTLYISLSLLPPKSRSLCRLLADIVFLYRISFSVVFNIILASEFDSIHCR